MSEIAPTLEDRGSTLTQLLDRVLAALHRLRVTPEQYRLATPGLWVFGAVLIVLAVLMPLFGSPRHVLLTQQALYIGLLALSLNLLVNTTGLISFGHAAFFAFGAYMVAVPFAKLDWSPLIGLGLSPVIGAVAALVIGVVVLRGQELYFALLTLGMGQLVWAGVHGYQSLTGGSNGTTGVFAADFIHPFNHRDHLFWFIFGCVAICTVLIWIVTRSPFGDALRGIRENRRRAEFTGLWIKRYELTAFVIAGTFGAVAGGLAVVSETQIASVQVDWQRSAIALIVVLIGGIRYFLGPFAGAIFWLFMFDWITSKTLLWDAVLGGIVLGIALFLPGGLVGAIHWLLAQLTTLARGLLGLTVPTERVLTAAEAEDVHLRDTTIAGEEVAAARPPPATAGAGLADGEPILRVEGVTKYFGGLRAVDDVSLELRRGVKHAIIGPNGAGKTTLFNLLTGLLPPDSGRVLLDGEDITGARPWRLVKRGLGRSFQQASLFWALSAVDNVTLADAAVKDDTLRVYGSQARSLRERTSTLLGWVGLTSVGQVPASDLSHGDQRSLEIATALAVESKLLLLDEPTAGLSPTETGL
ncbi:MAG: ATP-binding cassette domain-containing protein, partial [Gaiellales bacterium]